MSVSPVCPNCLLGHIQVFHEAPGVPANSCILLSSYAAALRYPSGDIRLGYCRRCGFIGNIAFDPRLTEYSERYEETQGFSPTFKRFHRQLADDLIARYTLEHKKILEIGCGKGEFLMLLCEGGRNTGIGFDPSYLPARNVADNSGNVSFVRDFYSEQYAGHSADFICCKMTLEHIAAPARFMATVRKAIAGDLNTQVFFMLPEARRILQDCAFEDIYYEHCCYFTPYSLCYLFSLAGFDVLETSDVYDGQYLCIFARPLAAQEPGPLPAHRDELRELSSLVAEFPRKFEAKKKHWQHIVDQHQQRGDKLILWGSGSKAVSFLTTLQVGTAVEYVVDVNPNRHGYFMPGTGQKIIAPESLASYQPDAVLVMNAVYRGEITQDLAAMGLRPQIHVL